MRRFSPFPCVGLLSAVYMGLDQMSKIVYELAHLGDD